MAGQYLTWLADVIRAAGVNVVEEANWKTRARSSGGFPVTPLAVQWHHTASSGSNPRGDINYMLYNSSARPIGNIYLATNGTAHILAAGASNTAGRGGPMNFSRGQIPLDSGNTRSVAIEAANNGVGQAWSQAQIDAFFKISNAINKKLGNKPADLYTHHGYAPTRKIDPATTLAVQGPWKPSSVNQQRTWSQTDVRNEATRRSGGTTTPPPTQPPPSTGTPWYTTVIAKMPTLKKGASGVYVKRLQHFLALAGTMSPTNMANFDGVFGTGTEGALNEFLASGGRPQNGTCDTYVWNWFMDTANGIPTIKKGQSGADVKRMQRLLSANGYMDPSNQGNFDGVWGSGTESAKSKFDNAYGLGPSPPTDCGPRSWESLLTGRKW